MWLSLLCKIKGSPTWKGKKDLSMNGFGTWCCRKVCPWSVLCERRDDRTQGRQGSIVLFIISYLNSHVITPCVIGPLSLRPTKKFCTVLHLPAPTLPSRAEHPICPFSILQACTDSHTFTTTSTFIQFY